MMAVGEQFPPGSRPPSFPGTAGAGVGAGSPDSADPTSFLEALVLAVPDHLHSPHLLFLLALDNIYLSRAGLTALPS